MEKWGMFEGSSISDGYKMQIPTSSEPNAFNAEHKFMFTKMVIIVSLNSSFYKYNEFNTKNLKDWTHKIKILDLHLSSMYSAYTQELMHKEAAL